MTKHKHAELIKAWADGAVIQYFRDSLAWEDVPGNAPVWDPTVEYRVKPQEMQPVLITRDPHEAAERIENYLRRHRDLGRNDVVAAVSSYASTFRKVIYELQASDIRALLQVFYNR